MPPSICTFNRLETLVSGTDPIRSMYCDRISELPDPLLTQILSYLPTKDSVKTSVLSKRWEFLWLEVSGLDLNANDFLPYGESLPSFMDVFLELNLKKWKIKYAKSSSAFSLDFSKRLMEWIAEVVHRGVQHLEVVNETCVDFDKETSRNVDFRTRRVYMRQNMLVGSLERVDNEKNVSEIKRKVDFMPKYMYVSKTLVSLKLVNVGLEDPKFVVSLPRLKKMHLENIYYMNGDGLLIIQELISASTVLEDLTMDVPNFPKKQKEIVFRKAPLCLISTLESVKIRKVIMEEKTGIKLVNYFLENSAVLKKLSLSLTRPCIENQEFYKNQLTSTKLSPRCQVFVY